MSPLCTLPTESLKDRGDPPLIGGADAGGVEEQSMFGDVEEEFVTPVAKRELAAVALGVLGCRAISMSQASASKRSSCSGAMCSASKAGSGHQCSPRR